MRKPIAFVLAALVSAAVVREARAASASDAQLAQEFQTVVGTIKSRGLQMSCVGGKSTQGSAVAAKSSGHCNGTDVNGTGVNLQSASATDAILSVEDAAVKALASGNRQVARAMLTALLSVEPAYAKIGANFKAYDRATVAALAKSELQKLGAGPATSTAMVSAQFQKLVDVLKNQRLEMVCLKKGEVSQPQSVFTAGASCSGTNINGSGRSLQSAAEIDGLLSASDAAAQALASGNTQVARAMFSALLSAKPAYANVDTYFKAYDKAQVAAFVKLGLKQLALE
jgi:hypothetical protein